MKRKQNKNYIIPVVVGVVIIFVIAVVIMVRLNSKNIAYTNEKGNIVVDVSKVGNKAVYYTHDFQNVDMEFFVVRDSNGNVRLAFNRCQVCHDSGRGYFVQIGDEFVCQNCGNRYKLFTIGTERGGCNPSPITPSDKIINGDKVEIKLSVFIENRYLFR